jgi:hypothetical protein
MNLIKLIKPTEISLHQLPADIIRYFTDWLSLDELCQFRLTNRNIEIKLRPRFLKLFIESNLNSPVDHAASYGLNRIIHDLTNLGYSITSSTVDCAAEYGQDQTFIWLHTLDHRGTNQAIDLAAQNGYLKTVELLHQNKYKSNKQALIKAASRGRLDIVKLLIDHKYRGFFEAIHEAVLARNVNVVRYLISLGYVCHKKSLIAAIKSNYGDVLAILLSNFPSIKPNEGTFDQCALSGHLSVLKVLAKYGFKGSLWLMFQLSLLIRSELDITLMDTFDWLLNSGYKINRDLIIGLVLSQNKYVLNYLCEKGHGILIANVIGYDYDNGRNIANLMGLNLPQ